MTDSDVETPVPSHRLRRLWLALGVLLLVVALLLASTYLSRRSLARQALSGWLEARGVEADVELMELGPSRLVARLRAGPKAAPDLTVERVEVDYGLFALRDGRLAGPEVRSVRLVKPVVRTTWRRGALSFGQLDRIVDEFRKRPPRSDARQPLILVEQGELRLDAGYGEARLLGDARLEDGKLMRLAARLAPGHLAGPGLISDVSGGRIDLTTAGGRTRFQAQLDLESLALDDARGEAIHLEVSGDAPYPDLEAQKQDGAVVITVRGRADQLEAGEAKGAKVTAAASFQGEAEGWLETLSVVGGGAIRLQAKQAAFADVAANDVQASLSAREAHWGHGHAASDLNLALSTGAGRKGDLSLSRLRVSAKGSGVMDPTGDWLHLAGGVQAIGGWRGLGPASRVDGPETAALKQALSSLSVTAPSVDLSFDKTGATVRLSQALRARSSSGAEFVLASPGGAPIYSASGGAAAVRMRGGGLPSLSVVSDRYLLDDRGLTAGLALEADGSYDLVRDAKVALRGELRARNGVVSFAPSACSPVRIGRLDFGDSDVVGVSGQLCPGAQPAFVLDHGQWRLAAALRGVAAEAPFLQAAARNGAASIRATGTSRGVGVEARITHALLGDTAPAKRFEPISLAGTARLDAEVWRGAFKVADAVGRKIGDATLRHESRSGRGELTLDTGELTFAEGGLQPAELSPLAAPIGSPAVGSARFEGGFRWSAKEMESGGVLTVPQLDFRSPAGAVSGLAGEVVFTSLAPLETPPGQVLTADAVEFLTPLQGAQIRFQIEPDALRLEAGGVQVGGGKVLFEPLRIPLGSAETWEGVMVVEGVQLSDIVEQAPFADRVDLQAKVSGRLPFVVGPEGLKIIQGKLEAIEPGRLSIQRNALSAVQAKTPQAVATVAGAAAPAAVEPEPFTVMDFAYQAMEDLAFDQLSAEVNSLPAGRLGVLFKIRGEHSPPKKQVIRLPLIDVIRRRFGDRQLPLPSGTKVDLTLDTTLNLDQLLQDYAAYQRARGSGPVQPPAGKP